MKKTNLLFTALISLSLFGCASLSGYRDGDIDDHRLVNPGQMVKVLQIIGQDKVENPQTIKKFQNIERKDLKSSSTVTAFMRARMYGRVSGNQNTYTVRSLPIVFTMPHSGKAGDLITFTQHTHKLVSDDQESIKDATTVEIDLKHLNGKRTFWDLWNPLNNPEGMSVSMKYDKENSRYVIEGSFDGFSMSAVDMLELMRKYQETAESLIRHISQEDLHRL